MNEPRFPMACEEFGERSLDALEGTLSGATAERFHEHRESCPTCRAEFEELNSTWRDLGDLERSPIEVPSARLRRALNRAIQSERETERGLERSGKVVPIGARLASAPRPALAPWLTGLAATLFLGLWLGARLERSGAEMRGLQAEVGSLRQMVALSMLRQPAASERLEGVRYGREIARPGSDVVETLFEVVRTDDNVNVRLAAVEALSSLLVQPTATGRTVGDELLAAFGEVRSPLVQAAIAAALLDEPATRTHAAGQFAATLSQGKLDPAVAAFLKRRLGPSA